MVLPGNPHAPELVHELDRYVGITLSGALPASVATVLGSANLIAMRKRTGPDNALTDEEFASVQGIRDWCDDDTTLPLLDIDTNTVGEPAVRPIAAGEVLRRLAGKIA
jgi:hypothetical protein